MVVMTTNGAARPVIPVELEGALGFQVTRLATLFKRELLKALHEFGLTPEQWQVLASLWWSRRVLTQNEICELTLKDKPTVSRMVRLMEKRKWIKRASHQLDGRANLVEITALGLKLQKEVPGKLLAHFSPLLSGLSREEHDTLLRLLRKVRKKFND